MKVGHAFSEHIHTEKKSLLRPRRFSLHHEQEIRTRWYILPILVIGGFLLLLGHMFQLQIVNGYKYRLMSDTNRFRTARIFAPRGIILDRNNTPLVYNVPGFRQTLNGKTKILSQEEAIALLAKGDKTVGVDSLRKYPFGESTGHILGYIGEISPVELKKSKFTTYKTGDLIGKMGIEAAYEDLLRGVDGQQLIEVDAFGKIIRTLGQTDPIPGQDIKLTLDAKLQQAVFTAMQQVKKGAVVVSTPKGEILAMLSKPGFDTNLFTLGKNYTPASQSAYTTISGAINDSENYPLLNRAIGGTYPPGSTFKLVTAAGALENKLIDKNYTVEDTGVLKVGEFSYANWYYTQHGKTEGEVDVVKALKRSNDIFFYKVGQKLGVKRLSQTAHAFSAGELSGIDIPGEVKGTLPSKEWKKETIGENWYLGDDFHYAIGQGYILTTPLQVNLWTQAVANKGMWYTPYFLKDKTSELRGDNLLTNKNYELIRQGMIESCQPGGVGWPLFNFSVKNKKLTIDNKNISNTTQATDSAKMSPDSQFISVACKTGTAQHGGEETLPHAWITLFAPAYDPQVIVTVLNEESGEGSNMAAPIARDILKAWFEK